MVRSHVSVAWASLTHRNSMAAARTVNYRFRDDASRQTRPEIIGNRNGTDVRGTSGVLKNSGTYEVLHLIQTN